jgi:hypothetical protein
MTIAEDRLLAYVDGLLSPEDAAALEAELRTDAEAAALVEAQRASDLPYREAAEALIPVPDLSEIEAFLADPPKPARTGTPVIRWIGAIAASVLLFVGGIYSGQNLFQPEKTQWAEWLEEIASYQALYTRETLSLGNPPPERVQRQMARVSKALGQEIKRRRTSRQLRQTTNTPAFTESRGNRSARSPISPKKAGRSRCA